jgi:hypothetical protein
MSQKEDRAQAWAHWKGKDGQLEIFVRYDSAGPRDVFVDLVIEGTAHVVTLDALVDALEEAKRVGHKIDCSIRCITVGTPMVN